MKHLILVFLTLSLSFFFIDSNNAQTGDVLIEGGLDVELDPSNPRLDLLRLKDNAGTKLRVFKNGTVSMGSNWGTPQASTLRVTLNKMYLKDSLFVGTVAGSNYFFSLVDGQGLRLFNSSNDLTTSIDNETGDLDIDGAASIGDLLTANSNIELRGFDPELNFWNPLPPGVGAQIKFDDNSGSGGNAGDLEIRNNQAAGDIEFYLNSSNLTLRMNNANTYSYVPFSPWTHKTTDLGADGKAWDDLYYDDLHNQGAAAFTDRSVTEELILHEPFSKKPGMFDYKTKRGLEELDPASLPDDLSADNDRSILTDEMVTYNYKANYEQQVEINTLKKQISDLQKQIEALVGK